MLADKALLKKSIQNPLLYVFYLGVLSLTTLVLIPFGFYIPGQEAIFSSLLSGVTFFIAWVAYFNALKYDEASRVAPITGTINPLFTLVIGHIFLSQTLNPTQLLAFFILIVGMVTISSSSWFKNKLEFEHFLLIITAGLFFATSSVLLRDGFLRSNFITGLVLSRIAMGGMAVGMLLLPQIRNQINNSKLSRNHFLNKTSFILITTQICGALGGLLITFSISLAHPAIINALQGTQYIFLLIGILLLSRKYRHLLDEESSRKAWIHKIIGSVIIGFGLAVLAFN